MSTTMKMIAGVAALVAIVGVLILINGKAQQSDPTLTKAPSPGPNAVTLQRSPLKGTAPLYIMTPGGPIPNPAASGGKLPASTH